MAVNSFLQYSDTVFSSVLIKKELLKNSKTLVAMADEDTQSINSSRSIENVGVDLISNSLKIPDIRRWL